MKKILALLGLFYFLNAFDYTSKQWLVLLHYKKTLFGYESLIDDKKFFVSKKGKTSPKDEFLASIKLIKKNPKKFACKFPLRYEILNKYFHLSNFNINKECPKLDKFLKALNPNKAVMVFASANLNSPSSMFGHTLIRIDTPSNQEYLSSAVNYAAHVTDKNGILFAFKGIFGFYKAYYSILPYYEKLKEYSDKDSRDLWGYELNFNKSEVRKMGLNIWELKDIYSYYYFFKENCAYNILYLIDVVNPSINSVGYYDNSFSVIPLDTVKLLYKKGIITKLSYMPSLVTQIETISKPLNEKQKKLIVNIANGKDLNKIDDINNSKTKARILDTSVRYLEYLSKKKSIPKKTYTKRFLKILKKRSKVKFISNYKYKIPYNPLFSHNSKRFSVFKGNGFLDFGLRLSYHQLDDNADGYKKGASLSFGNFLFRYKNKKIKIQKVGIIEIKSLAKRDIFFHPVSWKIDFGLYREENKLVLKLNPGGGFTKKIKNSYFYTLIQTDFGLNNDLHQGYELGEGLEAGVFGNYKKYTYYFSSNYINYVFGDKHKKYNVKLINNFKLSNQSAFILSFKREKIYHFNNEIKVGFYLYF